MRVWTCVAAAALLGLAAGAAEAYHRPGHYSSDDDDRHSGVYGPRNGTGTHYYGRQPNSGSDPWRQPRRPTVQHQWEQPPGTNTWEQPRKPDLYPWGKPKY